MVKSFLSEIAKKDVVDECTSNVFKVDNDGKLVCDAKNSWAGPGGGPSSFYTTWNYYFSFFNLFLAFFFPGVRLGVFSGVTVALGSFVSSATVFVVAQLLLGWNSGLKDDKDGLMKIEFANKIDQINAQYHAVPMLVSIVAVLIQASFSKGSFLSCCNPIMIAIPAGILFGVWLNTPVPVSKDSDENTTFRNKVNVVYNFPADWIILCGVVTFLASCFLPRTIYNLIKK
jgi:hypothetical protein